MTVYAVIDSLPLKKRINGKKWTSKTCVSGKLEIMPDFFAQLDHGPFFRLRIYLNLIQVH